MSFVQPQLVQPQTSVQAPVAPGNWQPTPDGLSRMLMLFCEPDMNAGQEHQRQLYDQYTLLSQHAEFTYYLAYILMHLTRHQQDVQTWIPHGSPNQVEEIRSRAGIELKNRIIDTWQQIDVPTREFIKQSVLSVLCDPSQFLRNIVGTIVTTICKRGGIANWPGILEHLVRQLDSGEHIPMDGAFNALAKICEDMPDDLDSEKLGRPLNILIPKFIQFFIHPHQDIRKYAIATVNVFLLTMPNALRTNMEAYMTNLFILAGRDTSKETRKRVCQAFVLLLDKEYNLLHNHIEAVIQFMLNASNDEDEQVSLVACEFWSAYCSLEQLNRVLLSKYLEHLIPIILKQMRYSPMELATLGEDDEDDQYVPDRAEDIAPRFHKSSSAVQGSVEDDDEIEFDDDEDDEFAESRIDWSLRKCAAAALDTLATVYKQDLLPILLPKLQLALNSRSDVEAEEKKLWVIRESAVLALGAIAEGCFDQLMPFLPALIPHLITNFLNDKKPLVRAITCWTLSRYCKWIIHETITTHKNNPAPLFQPLLQSLLQKILDKNKKVQETACSAFATLEEESRMMLVPYLKDILTTLMFAYGKYQAKNMLILYDALSTLSDAVHIELNKQELIAILMPPLMHKWNALSNTDKNLFPLLECLTAIAHALGKGFLIYAEPVFLRCAQLIEGTLQEQMEAEEKHKRKIDVDFPDKEFIVCALDLLSGLAEGLEENIEALIGKYDKRILGLLFQCMKDLDPDVRQSSFALLGDLAKTCMGHLRQYLGHFLPVCAANLNPAYYSVCNNASWSIGEIAVKAGADAISPYVPEIMRFLTPIMTMPRARETMTVQRERDTRALLENASVTIGRLAFVCAIQVAPHLDVICKPWMRYLTPLKPNHEKEHAFKGLACAIQQNPMAIYTQQAFPELISAIASWEEPTQELGEIFRSLLHSYKANLNAQWLITMSACEPKARMFVSQKYGV